MSDEIDKNVTEVCADVWDDVQPTGFSVKIRLDKAILNTIKLKNGENLIGRMPENDIMIDDPEVSRSHASINFDSEKGILSIEDMQSENGIILNGKKIKRAVLKEGDDITVGGHILSIIKADEYSYKPSVSDQIEKAGAQTWRLDQTVAGASPMAQEQILKSLKAQTVKTQKDLYGTAVIANAAEQEQIRKRMKAPVTNKPVARAPNKLSLKIGTGDLNICRDMDYDFVRDIDPQREKNLEDGIYINVKIGTKIFGKKIKF